MNQDEKAIYNQVMDSTHITLNVGVLFHVRVDLLHITDFLTLHNIQLQKKRPHSPFYLKKLSFLERFKENKNIGRMDTQIFNTMPWQKRGGCTDTEILNT